MCKESSKKLCKAEMWKKERSQRWTMERMSLERRHEILNVRTWNNLHNENTKNQKYSYGNDGRKSNMKV